MKEQDEKACNKYLNDQIEKFGEVPTMGEIWQAALELRDEQMKGTAITYQSMYEQERERSKKLVEAIDNISNMVYDYDLNGIEIEARFALKAYRGEK